MEEQYHIRQAFCRCDYPSWALNRLQTKIYHKFSSNQAHTTGSRHPTNNNSNNPSIFLVIPYTRGFSENFEKVCNKVGVQVHFRVNNTIHNLLVAPKDKDTITQKSGLIYWLKCTHAYCAEEYIEELERTFGERLKEHLRAFPPFTNIVSLQSIASM